MLAQTLEDPEARRFVFDRRITANHCGVDHRRDRPRLAGGAAVQPRSRSFSSAASRSATCRRAKRQGDAQGGLRRHGLRHPADSQLAVPARSRPAGSTTASPATRCSGRRASPRRCCSAPSTSSTRSFKGGDFKFWFGDSDEDFATATMEGGDVMPIGKGIVLIGMGERTTRQAVLPGRAQPVPPQGGDAGHRLPDAEEPRRHASRHGVQLLRPRSWSRSSRTWSRRSAASASIATSDDGDYEVRADQGSMLDVVRDALGLNELRVVADRR